MMSPITLIGTIVRWAQIGGGPVKTVAQTLHILTPLSNQGPDALCSESVIGEADLVADFRRFPAMVYQADLNGALADITSELLPAMPDYWTVAREWLAEFTARTDLQDLLTIEGYSFWWTLNGQKFVAGLTDVGNAFAWIDLLDAVSQRFSFGSVKLHGEHKILIRLVEEVCTGISIQVQPGLPASGRGKKQIPRHPGLLVARALMSIAYACYTLIHRPEICIFSSTNLLRHATVGDQQRLLDVYLGGVIEALREQGWRVAVVEKYGWHASWAGLIARGFFFPSDLLFFLSTGGAPPVLSRLGLHRSVRHRWHTRWEQVRCSLVPHLRYRDHDLAPLLLPLIAREFTHHAPDLEIMIGMWRRLFGWWRPRLVYVNNSYGRAALTAVVAAQSQGIPTVEQQHGVIGRNHIAYLVPRNLETTSEFPMCDTMTVWGEHTKRTLVDAGVYQPAHLAVCGFPRADLLLQDLPPRERTLAHLDIPLDVRVVLFTSNKFSQDFMAEMLDGLGSAPGDAGVYWILKLHPSETMHSNWKTAIKERQLEAVRLVQGDFDFYALLAACDLHVSFASTTLIESAILGKPNLGLEITYASDPAGYSEAKAFLPVPPGELGLVAHAILNDPGRKEQLLREQRRFAEDWCLCDGHAIDRIVSLVERKAAPRG
jgi:hypothetical protein